VDFLPEIDQKIAKFRTGAKEFMILLKFILSLMGLEVHKTMQKFENGYW